MKRRTHALLQNLLVVGFLTVAGPSAPIAAQSTKPPGKAQYLPLCGKCLTPTVFSKSGIGTADAIAKAKVTYKDAKDNCEAFSMDEHPNCDKDAKDTLKQENGKIYEATADCIHGKITLATGDKLTYAGIWPSGYLKGKTRWRFVSSGYDNGHFANEDGPTNGFMVDATSKILCPSGIGGARKH